MKSSVKFGITTGLISAIVFYVEFFSGIAERSAGLLSLIATAAILAGSIYFYLRKIASPELNGFYTIRYGFKRGMALVAACSIVIALGTFIFFEFVNPNYIEYLIAEGINEMQKSGASVKEIETAAEDFRKLHSPLAESVKSMIRVVAMGAFFSGIISLVVKRWK